MVDPGNSKTINEIVYQTGLKPTVIMVTHYEYEAFLQTYYENEREAANKMLKEIENERIENANEDSLWDQVENAQADAQRGEEASLLAAASVMLLAATESTESSVCSIAVKEQNAHHAALRRSAATLHNAPRPSRGERSLRAELPCPRPADRYVYALRRIVI